MKYEVHISTLRRRTVDAFDPNEPRDGTGEWTKGGGSAPAKPKYKSSPYARLDSGSITTQREEDILTRQVVKQVAANPQDYDLKTVKRAYSDLQMTNSLSGNERVELDAKLKDAISARLFAETPEVFHGTTSAYLDSIVENGLQIKPSQRSFGEEFGFDGFYEGERGESVFVTTDWDTASFYAEEATDRFYKKTKETPEGTYAVILAIRIPAEERAKMEVDEKQSNAFFRKGGIPAEWIVEARDPTSNEVLKKFHDAAIPQVVYVVVLCDGAATHDAWEETKHPRGQPENKGEFAKAPGGGASVESNHPAPRINTTGPSHALRPDASKFASAARARYITNKLKEVDAIVAAGDNIPGKLLGMDVTVYYMNLAAYINALVREHGGVGRITLKPAGHRPKPDDEQKPPPPPKPADEQKPADLQKDTTKWGGRGFNERFSTTQADLLLHYKNDRPDPDTMSNPQAAQWTRDLLQKFDAIMQNQSDPMPMLRELIWDSTEQRASNYVSLVYDDLRDRKDVVWRIGLSKGEAHNSIIGRLTGMEPEEMPSYQTLFGPKGKAKLQTWKQQIPPKDFADIETALAAVQEIVKNDPTPARSLLALAESLHGNRAVLLGADIRSFAFELSNRTTVAESVGGEMRRRQFAEEIRKQAQQGRQYYGLFGKKVDQERQLHNTSWAALDQPMRDIVDKQKPIRFLATQDAWKGDVGRSYMRANTEMFLNPAYDADDKATVFRHEYGHAVDYNSQVSGYYSSAEALSQVKEDSNSLIGKVLGRQKTLFLHADLHDNFEATLARMLEGTGISTDELMQYTAVTPGWALLTPSRQRALQLAGVLAGSDYTGLQDKLGAFRLGRHYIDQKSYASAPSRDATMLSDFVGSLTNNQIGDGHEQSYYDADPNNRATEAFANYVCLKYSKQGSKVHLALMRSIAPKTVTKFEEILARKASELPEVYG